MEEESMLSRTLMAAARGGKGETCGFSAAANGTVQVAGMGLRRLRFTGRRRPFMLAAL